MQLCERLLVCPHFESKSWQVFLSETIERLIWKNVPDVNVIDKFTFSADFKATDVGDLTQARYGSGCGGVQG